MSSLTGLIILVIVGVFFGFLLGTWNYLRVLAKNAGEAFQRIFHLFKKRQNRLPFLFQVILEKVPGEKELVGKMIKRREEEMRLDHNNMRVFLKDELVFRHYLETLMSRLADETKIKKEVNFLEAKKRVLEIQEEIERKEKTYNHWAKEYNESLERPIFGLAIKVMGLEELVLTEE